jgi:hypothetical protein
MEQERDVVRSGERKRLAGRLDGGESKDPRSLGVREEVQHGNPQTLRRRPGGRLVARRENERARLQVGEEKGELLLAIGGIQRGARGYGTDAEKRRRHLRPFGNADRHAVAGAHPGRRERSRDSGDLVQESGSRKREPPEPEESRPIHASGGRDAEKVDHGVHVEGMYRITDQRQELGHYRPFALSFSRFSFPVSRFRDSEDPEKLQNAAHGRCRVARIWSASGFASIETVCVPANQRGGLDLFSRWPWPEFAGRFDSGRTARERSGCDCGRATSRRGADRASALGRAACESRLGPGAYVRDRYPGPEW